jgi:hypothetical protein
LPTKPGSILQLRTFGYTKTEVLKERLDFVDGIFINIHSNRLLLVPSFDAEPFKLEKRPCNN